MMHRIDTRCECERVRERISTRNENSNDILGWFLSSSFFCYRENLVSFERSKNKTKQSQNKEEYLYQILNLDKKVYLPYFLNVHLLNHS